MIGSCNFVRGAARRGWAPARSGGTEPCFAARETSGDATDNVRLRNRLAFALPAPQICVNDVEERPSALACRAVMDVLTLVAPGSVLVGRSHDYPVFLPLRGDRAAVASSLRCLFPTTW